MRLTLSGTGQLERAEVEAALERHLAQFQRCYVNALDRDAGARGVVRLEWTIARSGGVSDVVVLRSDIADDTMLRCIDEEVRRVRFPQPVDGAVRVQYPFVFRSLGD
jgi:outer membrane biosynthesis protein TonB